MKCRILLMGEYCWNGRGVTYIQKPSTPPTPSISQASPQQPTKYYLSNFRECQRKPNASYNGANVLIFWTNFIKIQDSGTRLWKLLKMGIGSISGQHSTTLPNIWRVTTTFLELYRTMRSLELIGLKCPGCSLRIGMFSRLMYRLLFTFYWIFFFSFMSSYYIMCCVFWPANR